MGCSAAPRFAMTAWDCDSLCSNCSKICVYPCESDRRGRGTRKGLWRGSRWLGLAYSAAQFEGIEEGGLGLVDVIPWSKLAPDLRKGGIVPQADWSAPLPATNQ